MEDLNTPAVNNVVHHLGGILNWLLEGTYRWRKERLRTPAAISTDEYRGEMDVIGNFLKESCAQKPGATIRIRELFKVLLEVYDCTFVALARFCGLSKL